MAITYPVDVVNTRWATLDTVSGELIARRQPWPRSDGSAREGVDPRYVMLLHVDATPPDYDSRLYFLQSTETVDGPNNELRLTHQAIERPIEEQKNAAENEEAAQLSRHIKVERELIETRLMVGAILAYIVDQQQFPPKVRTQAQAYVAKAVKLWNNRDNLKAILTALDAGQKPDLDAGWEPVA